MLFGFVHLANIEGVTVTVHPPVTSGLKALGVPINLGRQRVPAVLKAPWSSLVEGTGAALTPLEINLNAASLRENTEWGLKLGEEWKVKGLNVRIEQIPDEYRLKTFIDGELIYTASPGNAEEVARVRINAREHVSITAREHVSITAREHVSIIAREHVSIIAREHVSVNK